MSVNEERNSYIDEGFDKGEGVMLAICLSAC